MTARSAGRRPDELREASMRRDLALILGVALAVRLLVGAAIWIYVAQTGDRFIAPDEQTYLHEGSRHVDGFEVPHPYGHFVGLLFDAFGEHDIVPRLVNVVVGALLAGAVLVLGRQLGLGNRTARLGALGAALWPSLVLWSVQALKDPLVHLCLAAAIGGAIAVSRGRFVAVPVVLAAATMAEVLRDWVFPVLTGAIVGGIVVTTLARRSRPSIATYVLVVGLGLVGVAGDQGPFGIDLALGRASIEEVEAIRAEGAGPEATPTPTTAAVPTTVAAGEETPGDPTSTTTTTTTTTAPVNTGTGFADRSTDTIGDVLAGTGRGIVYGILGPFPWQPDDPLAAALLIVELPLWYAALWFAVRGALAIRRRLLLDSWSAVPIFIVGVTLVIATYVGNGGTAFRQRGVTMPWILLFSSIGVVAWLDRRGRRPGDLGEPADGAHDALVAGDVGSAISS